jgi:hypothetical protein
MHDPALHNRALELIAAGVNDCEIGRRLGVARTTVRHWRWAEARDAPPRDLCWRCWRRTRRVELAAPDYAELLGLYLGDGHISRLPRTERLRLLLDARYPTIVAEAEALLRRVFPECRVGRVVADRGSTVVLWVHHGHLSCLFPQHGPGKKHERPIELEPWQCALVGSAPWAFVRGCIRSDGCSFVNRTGRYAYLSYEFRNWSTDILGLFASTCAAVGLHPRQYGDRVRLCRRADVAELVSHVGVKS